MFNIRQFVNGLRIIPVPSLSLDRAGEMQVLSSDGKLYYHDNTSISPLVTESGSTTITNKNLADNTTFIVNNSDGTLRIGFNSLGTTGTTTTIASSQTVNRVITLPDATDTLVGRNTTDTLTNKSISGLTNTLTNIPLTTAISGILPIANGGTNASTKAGSFDSLSPMTTGGDLIYGGASGTGTRLGNGSNGQVLTSSGGTAAPIWTTPSPGFLNPMTTAGDLIIGGSGGSPTRLGATTNGFILTLVSGSPTWVIAPTTGANTALSNLTTTSINQSLIPATDGAISLGTTSHRWDQLFTDTKIEVGVGTTLALRASTTTPTSTSAAGLSEEDGLLPLSLVTASNAASNSTATTNLLIETGNKLAGTGNSGNINLTTGTSSGGSRGKITLNSNSVLFNEIVTPSNPPSTFDALYFKSNHLLYSKDSTGTERLIGAGGFPTVTVTTLLTSSGTYTVPAGVAYIKVKMVGGGAGGGGGNNGSIGGAGSDTTFGTSFLIAGGGAGGAGSGGTGGTGGIVTPLPIGAIGIAVNGGGAGSGVNINVGTNQTGGVGGASALGGAGHAGTSSGGAGEVNTGGGGGGSGITAGNTWSGGGGGSGAYIEAYIPVPSSTYSYSVGGGGSGGSGGPGGGAGGDGVIMIEEYYQ